MTFFKSFLNLSIAPLEAKNVLSPSIITDLGGTSTDIIINNHKSLRQLLI